MKTIAKLSWGLSDPFRKTLAVGFFAVLVPLLCQATNSPPTAYILVGDAEPTQATENIYTKAKADYERAGYTVITKWKMDAEDLQAALDDPSCQCLWYIGHGRKEDEWLSTVFVNPKNGKTQQGSITSSGLTFHPDSALKEVVFHACYQDQQSWRDKFGPAVKFYSWGSTTSDYKILYWEYWFHTIPSLGGEPSSDDPPRMDGRIRPTDFPVGTTWDGINFPITTITTVWRLGPALRGLLDPQTSFNFYTTDKKGQQVWLLGGDVQDGYLHADQFGAPLTNVSFDVRIDGDSIGDVLLNRDVWPGLYGSNSVSITTYDSGLDPRVAYRATGSLLFGLEDAELIPEPTSFLMLLFGLGLSVLRCIAPSAGAPNRRSGKE